MKSDGRVLVTGATGWIGREVCGWLEGHGLEVRKLDRPQGIDGVVPLDLMAEEGDPSWSVALRGCLTVVHCAGHVHRPVETAEERRLFHAINVEGTRKLLAVCRLERVRRVVFVSTSALYDWSDGKPKLEAGPLRPMTAYAASKLEAENLVRNSGLDWRIARLGTVFGVGDRANFQRLAHALKRRRFIIPGRGDARKSVLSVERAGELLGRLAIGVDESGITVNLAAPSAPSLEEICNAFSKQCGFATAIHAPLSILRCAGLAGSLLQSAGIKSPLTTDILRKLTTSTVLDVTKMLELFPDLEWSDFESNLSGAASYYVNA